MGAMSKDLSDLKRLCEKQGWTVDISGNHLKWYPPEDAPNLPDTGFFTTSKTPSDSNIITTIKKEFEACGLILDRTEWKRRNKKSTLNLPSPAKEGKPAEIKSLRGMTEGEIMDYLLYEHPELQDADPKALALMAMIAHRYDLWYTICSCGRKFIKPTGLIMHVASRLSEKNDEEEYAHIPVTAEQAEELERERQAEQATETAGETPETSAPTTPEGSETAPEGSEKTTVDTLLTADEHRAIELLNEVTILAKKIVGDGGEASDLQEMEALIGNLQARFMSQAAARAYPDLYRLLGEKESE